MVQNKLPLINSAHGSETRNIINELIKLFNGMGYTYDEALQKAHDTLAEAKRTNQKNNNTNERLDKIIADSGTSSTEVIDARGDAPVLGGRINNHENQIIETDFVEILKNKMYFSEMSLIKTHDAGMQQFDVFLKSISRQVKMTFAKPDDYFKLSGVTVSDVDYQPTSIHVSSADLDYTGSWVLGTIGAEMKYATKVGDSAEYQFTNPGVFDINFRHFADNRGGILRFTLNGGNPVDVSTFKATTGTVVDKIYTNVTAGTYTLKVEFIGDDPVNPPSSGAGKSRGWLYSETVSASPVFTFDILGEEESQSGETTLMANTSNKEFAFMIAPNSNSSFNFVPQHSSKTGFYKNQPIFILDGKEFRISDFNIGEEVKMKNFQFIQEIYGRHPDSGNTNLCVIKTVHTVNLDGSISVDGSFEALRNMRIGSSYVLMSPVNNRVFDSLQTGWGNQYPITKTDGSITDLIEDADCANYVFTSSSNDYFVAYKHSDKRGNFDVNGSGAKDYHNFIQHRDADLAKHYINIFAQQGLSSGYKLRWSGVYIAGSLRNVYDLMSSK